MNKGVPVLLIMTILTGIALSSNVVSADNNEVIDTVELTVPVACTMSGTGTTHNATLNPGTYSAAGGSDYEAGIGKTTLQTVCNDYNGFSIYAIGFTGDSYDSTNHTKLVGASTNQTIDTAVYTNGDTTSSWSMKLNKVTDTSTSYNPGNLTITTSYDSWHAVPASYTKVAEYHASTGSSATDTVLGSKLETTYAVYISSTQPADTYSGQVKYTLVHPYTEQPLQPQQATAGCINYFPNGSNVIGTMGCQSATDGQTKDLLASNFSRTGYGFAGWSDKFDYATNQSAHFYGPQETITVPTGTTANGLSLYAVWVKSAGSLQDSVKVSQLCGAGTGSLIAAPTDGTANLSSVSALTDQRDNETYAIAKLADGKCWMIENLRLESTADHNSDGSLAQGYGISTTYGNFSGLADAESTGFWSTYSANSLYYSGTQSGGASIDIGTSNYPAYRMPRYNNWNNQSSSSNRPQNPTSNNTANNTTKASMYSYGNYYTWHAAISNLAFNGINNNSATSTSICPSGWRLPQGGDKTRIESNDDNDFWNLTVDALNGGTNPVNYDSNLTPYYNGATEAAPITAKLRSYPNNFLYSGRFYSSSISSRGSYGAYWSSTSYGNYYSYEFNLNDSIVRPTSNSDKYNGYSIRCMVSAGT